MRDFFLILGVAFFMSACNHLFYYPSREMYTDPKQVGIDYEALTIPSEDPIELSAWWLKPAPQKRRGQLVVQLHGNAENMSSHFLFVAWLIGEGYDVLTFDYRGYGLSTPANPSQEGLVTDTCHLFTWLQTQSAFADLPTFVIGQSLGGAVAVSSLARCPYPRLRGLVIDSSFGSYRGLARTKLSGFWLTWPLQYPLSFLVSDAEASPNDLIKNLSGTPLLFFHSPQDPVVPYQAGRELFTAAGEPKTWVAIGAKGHTGALSAGSPYRAELLRFFTASSSR